MTPKCDPQVGVKVTVWNPKTLLWKIFLKNFILPSSSLVPISLEHPVYLYRISTRNTILIQKNINSLIIHTRSLRDPIKMHREQRASKTRADCCSTFYTDAVWGKKDLEKVYGEMIEGVP